MQVDFFHLFCASRCVLFLWRNKPAKLREGSRAPFCPSRPEGHHPEAYENPVYLVRDNFIRDGQQRTVGADGRCEGCKR